MTPIFQFTSSTTDQILAMAGGMIGSVMPLLVIILGISIALWILDHFLLRR